MSEHPALLESRTRVRLPDGGVARVVPVMVVAGVLDTAVGAGYFVLDLVPVRVFNLLVVATFVAALIFSIGPIMPAPFARRFEVRGSSFALLDRRGRDVWRVARKEIGGIGIVKRGGADAVVVWSPAGDNLRVRPVFDAWYVRPLLRAACRRHGLPWGHPAVGAPPGGPPDG
jgi:hypothetical protein